MPSSGRGDVCSSRWLGGRDFHGIAQLPEPLHQFVLEAVLVRRAVVVGPLFLEAGIRWPVALTRAVWERCVAVPPGVACQDEAGRLWDVVWLLACAIYRCPGPEVRFGVHVRNDNRDRTPPLVRLKALYGPGDEGSPCITVMLPDED